MLTNNSNSSLIYVNIIVDYRDMEEEKVQTLIEIIYELYKEDIKGGKLRSCEQAVEKSAPQSLTFQWPA
jgi:hypothetical protein